jgi:hypothetical protein
MSDANRSTTARILDRLEGVKATGPSSWIAKCPAHPDRKPSLSIRETDDGRVLLHCFAGCSVGDVLAVIGLQLRDLFDQPVQHFTAPSKSRIAARDVLHLVSYEIDVAGLLLAHVVEGRSISEAEWQRLAQAAARISHAKVSVHGH